MAHWINRTATSGEALTGKERMSERERLEALVKEVAAETEKILLQELRGLILQSAPMMAQVNGEQACQLLVRTLDAWGTSRAPST